MNKLKFIIGAIAMAVSITFAQTGWEIANPSTGGNAQIRAGVSLAHEYESASPYVKARVIKTTSIGSAELSAYTNSGEVTKVALRIAAQDYAAIAIESDGQHIKTAVQGYYTVLIGGLPVQLAAELNYDSGSETIGGVIEADAFTKYLMFLGGSSIDSDYNWSPYVGAVYHLTDNVDVGLVGFWAMNKGDCMVKGYSSDITLKF